MHAGLLIEEGLKEWGNGGGHASMAGGFVPDDRLPEDPQQRYDAVQNHFIEVIRRIYPNILEDTAE